jgi:cytochrome c-type biogenesis protein CcmH
MISLWLGISLLSLVALFFILWPVVRTRSSTVEKINERQNIQERLAENIALFREHIIELEQQLSSGRIDQTQFEQLKLEQERILLADEIDLRKEHRFPFRRFGFKSFALLGILIIAVAWTLYSYLGSSADAQIKELIAAKQAADYQDMLQGKPADPERARHLVRQIEERLADDSESAQYWFILARTYMELKNYAEAVKAYQAVVERDPQSITIMAELAQAIFLRDDNKITPPVIDLTNKVLAAEPDNTTALGLAGIHAFGEKNYLVAIKHWERVIKITGPESPSGQALAAGIERAKVLYLAAGGDQQQIEAAKTGRQLTVNVNLKADVGVRPNQLVFVYARAWQGAKMPLAITRFPVSELPKKVILTEAMAMTPAMSLASVDQVELVARISEKGTATAEAGDWQGSLGPVDMKAEQKEFKITIDTKIQ